MKRRSTWARIELTERHAPGLLTRLHDNVRQNDHTGLWNQASSAISIEQSGKDNHFPTKLFNSQCNDITNGDNYGYRLLAKHRYNPINPSAFRGCSNRFAFWKLTFCGYLWFLILDYDSCIIFVRDKIPSRNIPAMEENLYTWKLLHEVFYG